MHPLPERVIHDQFVNHAANVLLGRRHFREALFGQEATNLDFQTADETELKVNVSTPFDLPGTSATTPQQPKMIWNNC